MTSGLYLCHTFPPSFGTKRSPIQVLTRLYPAQLLRSDDQASTMSKQCRPYGFNSV